MSELPDVKTRIVNTAAAVGVFLSSINPAAAIPHYNPSNPLPHNPDNNRTSELNMSDSIKEQCFELGSLTVSRIIHNPVSDRNQGLVLSKNMEGAYFFTNMTGQEIPLGSLKDFTAQQKSLDGSPLYGSLEIKSVDECNITFPVDPHTSGEIMKDLSRLLFPNDKGLRNFGNYSKIPIDQIKYDFEKDNLDPKKDKVNIVGQTEDRAVWSIHFDRENIKAGGVFPGNKNTPAINTKYPDGLDFDTAAFETLASLNNGGSGSIGEGQLLGMPDQVNARES